MGLVVLMGVLFLVAHALAVNKPCPVCRHPHIPGSHEGRWYECRSKCGTIWDSYTGQVVGLRQNGIIVLYDRAPPARGDGG